jgi:endoglucanase
MKSLNIVLIGLTATLFCNCTKKADTEVSIKPVPIVNPLLNAKGKASAFFAGANWADPKNNFNDGVLILSGTAFTDNYEKLQGKANVILTTFQNAGINTIRLPINPPTVTTDWWNVYSGAIDKATEKGMKVILCCWESKSSPDGKVDDTAKFWEMWQKVITKYQSNESVYFEVFNEPHGYSLTQLTELYLQFLNTFPNIPRGRILLGGTNYSGDVTKIGADSRFDGCLLSIHDYSFFVSNRIKTTAEWETRFRSHMHPYEKRTVLTEFGAPMTNGANYLISIEGDGEKAYIQGMTNVCRAEGMSSVYWPGLRDGDGYSLFRFNGIDMSTTNNSGLSKMQFGWGI